MISTAGASSDDELSATKRILTSNNLSRIRQFAFSPEKKRTLRRLASSSRLHLSEASLHRRPAYSMVDSPPPHHYHHRSNLSALSPSTPKGKDQHNLIVRANLFLLPPYTQIMTRARWQGSVSVHVGKMSIWRCRGAAGNGKCSWTERGYRTRGGIGSPR